jgi:leucine dehydrogenase
VTRAAGRDTGAHDELVPADGGCGNAGKPLREHDERGVAGQAAAHELLMVRRGPRTGAHLIVAVHSTALGPALGGCRLWRYEDLDAAVTDALRLSRAMTLKAAAARLSLGGGKAVAFPPPELELAGEQRTALMQDFADSVNLLDGAYITAEDVGTTTDDMALLSRHTRHVVGVPTQIGGSGDPGAFTARGVQAAMRACCARAFDSADLAPRSVAVVGLGHVGEPLARGLARAGARLVLADIDPAKQALARELGALWRAPQEALLAEVDVLAPCAMGGVLDGALARAAQAQVICGSANNQLADERVAELLAARGILYAPDFIANAGGLINVALELEGYDRELAQSRIDGIELVLGEILDHSSSASTTPLAAAEELARRRIAAAPTERGRPVRRPSPRRRSPGAREAVAPASAAHR